MPATTQDWTVAMLDALPDDGQRYEIFDGELFVTRWQGDAHQEVVCEVLFRLWRYLGDSNVGKVMLAPTEVWCGDRDRNRVFPDVFVVCRIDGKRPEYPYHLRHLLLAVEVVSPGTPLVDYHAKRELYLREGVGEYWVIDPEARIVFRWSRSRSNNSGEPGEVLSAELRWRPEGMASEFVLNLPQFFDEAFG